MGAYYNENDHFAAAWLRELIKGGLIADGEIDTRSITEVRPADLAGLTQCHFFGGIGVWSYALRCAGWLDSKPVWTGSCPCQPFSVAGKKEGITDPRHLWPEWFRLIQECKPVTIFGEQVAAALPWFDIVSGDLEGEDYAVGAAVVGAHSVGAPHIRQRLYFVADANGRRFKQRDTGQRTVSKPDANGALGDATGRGFGMHGGAPGSCGRPALAGFTNGFWRDAVWLPCRDGKARPVEPEIFPLASGIANRVGLLRGAGNALTAPVAQAFIEAYLTTVLD